MIPRKLVRVDFNDYSKDTIEGGEPNLITSIVLGDEEYHAPVLDIDFPVFVIPSSTPGHFHLFIEKKIHESQYLALLDVLAYMGIIEDGYAHASNKRKYSGVRLPWILKEKVDDPPEGIIVPGTITGTIDKINKGY